MIRYFLLFIFFIPFSLFSQEEFNVLLNAELQKNEKEFNGEVNFQKAAQYFQERNWDSVLIYSMKQLNAGKTSAEIADYCHFFRGVSFNQKDLFTEAMREFNLVSDRFRFYYIVKINLGEITLELNDFQKSLIYFNDIEHLPDSISYGYNKCKVYHNIGVCYIHLKDYPMAEQYLQKSLALAESEKDTSLLMSNYNDIANLYYVQYKDSLAIPFFIKAYKLSKLTDKFRIKKTTALNMSVVEENRNNLLAALTYRKEYEQWKDSLNDQNKVWEIAQLEKKFAVQQKEKEIAILESENKIKQAQRNSLLIASVLLFGMFVAVFYFYRQKIKSNRIILLQKQELDELNSTKDKLFSIVSHDLRSSVNALKKSNAKLAETLSDSGNTTLDKMLIDNSEIANGAYNLLDNLLNWAMLQTQQLYFQKETLHLHSVVSQTVYNYRSLMTEKNIIFKNSVPGDVFIIADLDSLKIILRNLIDNAIKFTERAGNISIYVRASTDNFCHLVVEDTGIGMSAEMQQELLKDTVLLTRKRNEKNIGSGLGTQLCKLMLKKNGGELLVESQENKGTRMIILLPKTEHNG